MTEALAIVVGSIVGLVPLAAGLAVFFAPLKRKTSSDKFLRVATLESLPDDGVPRQFPVITERVDAWNRSLEPVGAVYLKREGENLECWTATCPHAGCFVAYDPQSNVFRCPCHNSSFAADGAIIEPSPSPRAMDTLECKIAGQEVLVQFREFYTGKTEKVPKS